MTDRIALVIWLIVAGLIALDIFVLHTGSVFFLLKKLDALIEWLAFWR